MSENFGTFIQKNVAKVPNIVHVLWKPHTETGYIIIYCNCLESSPAATLQSHKRGGVGLRKKQFIWTARSGCQHGKIVSLQLLTIYETQF